MARPEGGEKNEKKLGRGAPLPSPPQLVRLSLLLGYFTRPHDYPERDCRQSIYNNVHATYSIFSKEGKNDAVQIQNQGHDTGNSGEDCSQTTLKDKKGSKNHAKGINKADQEQTMAKKRNSQGYFANDNRESMTVVFHAVLAPYFKFEKTKGDKVVMRFGGPAFGHFGEDIIEMQLENM